jgi:hypothetical protein
MENAIEREALLSLYPISRDVGKLERKERLRQALEKGEAIGEEDRRLAARLAFGNTSKRQPSFSSPSFWRVIRRSRKGFSCTAPAVTWWAIFSRRSSTGARPTLSTWWDWWLSV